MTPEWEQDARDTEAAAAPHGRCVLCDGPLTGDEEAEVEGPEGGYWSICDGCAAKRDAWLTQQAFDKFDAAYGMAGQTPRANE